MTYHKFPTHLGGEWANLEWEDLKPEELAWAAAGSTIKGAAIAPLAYEQAAAAAEEGLPQEQYAYLAIANLLERAARPKTYSRP